MGLLSKFFNNARKPVGFLGKLMVNGMNGGDHAAMANWALSSLPIKGNGQILDVGCGGGANIARLLKCCPNGTVTGIDYSSVSVEKSRQVNAQAIRESRCKVVEGSVAELPFGKDTFDMVTAFETIYFWPDIEHCFNEVKRVLKDGGVFAIVNEDDGLSGTNERWEKIIEGMHTYTPQEIRLHLTNTGFSDINVERNETKHWLMATAKK